MSSGGDAGPDGPARRSPRRAARRRDERRAVEDDPRRPTESTRASATSPGASRLRPVRSARPATASTAGGSAPPVPVTVRQLAEPRSTPGCGRLDVPGLVEHDQPRRFRAVGVGGLAEQQAATRALGQRRPRPRAGNRSPRARTAADPARGRGRGSPMRLRRSCAARAAAPGRLRTRCSPASGGWRWDRPRWPRAGSRARAPSARRPRVVDVVLEYSERDRLRRQLRDGLVEVARDQQRRRVEREPARRHVVGDHARYASADPSQNATRSSPLPASETMWSSARSLAYGRMGAS